MKKTCVRLAATAVMLVCAASSAYADSLTLYCAADEAWCQQIKTASRKRPASPST